MQKHFIAALLASVTLAFAPTFLHAGDSDDVSSSSGSTSMGDKRADLAKKHKEGAQSHTEKAVKHAKNGDHKSAAEAHTAAADLLSGVGSHEEAANSHLDAAQSHKNSGPEGASDMKDSLLSAVDSLAKAAKEHENDGNVKKAAEIHADIADALTVAGKPDEAIEAHVKAISLQDENDDGKKKTSDKSSETSAKEKDDGLDF